MVLPDQVFAGGGVPSLGVSSPSSKALRPKAVEDLTEAAESVSDEKEKTSAILVDSCPASRGGGSGGNGGIAGGCGVGTDSSSPMKTEIHDRGLVNEEEMEEEEEAEAEDIGGAVNQINYNNNRSSSSSSPFVVLPESIEGLYHSGLPPFLKKTFAMVETPETDPIVSWSETGDSFIVWDSHEFSKHLLPKYFKHSNFTSFIRQLNIYGFRKIGLDRWEFWNEGFQRGKKNLLKNIKRRSRNNKQHNEATSGFESPNLGLEFELKNLKNDRDGLKVEIMKLRRELEDTQNQLSAVEERIRAAKCKQQQMLLFFIKVAKNPGLIPHLVQKRKNQEELDGGESSKKRKLLATQVPECLLDAVDISPTINCRNQSQEQLAAMQTELTETLPETVEDHQANLVCGKGAQDASSVYNLMSEKLMDDNWVVENPGDEDLDLSDSKFYLELEGLIGRPRNWSGFVATLVEGAGCIR